MNTENVTGASEGILSLALITPETLNEAASLLYV